MSQVIMDNRASLNCCEKKQKFAVRLRLRKRGKQSQKTQEIQNGIVSSTLKEENIKLSKSIEKLTSLREDNLTMNLKNCLESISNYHSNQIKYQNQIVSTIVKKMKDNLRVFNSENLLLVAENQKQRSKLGDSEQFASNSSEIPKVLNGTSKNEVSLTIQSQQASKQEEDISIENKEIKEKRNELLKSKQYFISSHSNSYKISERSSQYDEQKKDDDDKQDYKQMIEMNTELRVERSQMQQYIQNLKQQLVEKQKTISNLNKRLSAVEQENQQFHHAIDLKSAEYKILEQQIMGYEQKIQSLEQQIRSLNSSAINQTQRTNHSRTNSNIQDNSSKSIGKAVSIELEIEQAERQEDSKNSKEMGIKNLQKIYQKTEETLRKYKKLEREKARVQEQCQQLRIKIEQILNTIYEICDEQKQQKDLAQLQLKQVINLVGEVLDRKLSIIQLQHNERENKLQSMIADELDQTLIIIASLCSNEVDENIINEQSTILDKIQYLRHNIQYIYLNLTNKLNTSSYFNILFSLYGKIDHIIEKSHLFAQQLEHNNHMLTQISAKFQEQQALPVAEVNSNKNKLVLYLSELEQLLAANEQFLIEDNIGYVNFYKLFCSQNGTNVEKVQKYLSELEQIMKQIYKNQNQGKDEDHQKCLQERIELKTKIKELEKKNSEYATQMQKLIADISQVDTQQDLKRILEGMLELNQQLRRQNIHWHKNDILLQQSTFRRIKQQVIKLQRKYFPSNPQFIDTIINQLGQVRKVNSQQSFLRIADSIFKAIKNRDEKFSQEMGRRKQVLKQRTAVISQICKKGIKDSSIEEHSFTKKQ